jgi:hypothetical protein
MAELNARFERGELGATLRRDAWWVELLPIIAALLAFGAYATLRAFEGAHYSWGPYLSPFYSPLLKPSWWPFSPAILILWVPLGFRLTCYYYRKAYYRSFFLDPPACGVGEARRVYRGETAFPFVLQNLHRYFLFPSILFLVVLWYDVIRAFSFEDGFGVGIGSVVLLVNILLLTLYTFSCHSLRHIMGGRVDCFSCSAFGRSRYKAWRFLSRLNERHMLFAWVSLFSVGLTDLYIRLVATGTIRDLRLI